MLQLFLLLAEGDKPAPEGGMPGWATFVPLIAMFLLFYFVLVLPAQRKEKKQRELLMNSLKKNSKVVTQGGMIGVVSYINEGEDEVTLRLEEGKVKVLKSSIIKVFNAEEQTSSTAIKA